MTAKKLKKVLALTIASLGLHPITRNKLAMTVLIQKNKETYDKSHRHDGPARATWDELRGGDENSRLKSWAEEYTVQDVMDALEDSCDRRGWYGNGTIKLFIKKLVELGLTRADWKRLPQETMKGKEPKTQTMKPWLKKSILLLGTLSPNAIEDLEYIFEKKANLITLGELLGLTYGEKGRRNWAKSYENTVAKLRLLGFINVDGPFLVPNASERKEMLYKSLMKEDKLSSQRAIIVLNVALRRGWVS